MFDEVTSCYYIDFDEKKLKKLTIVRDETADCPRKVFNNIGHLCLNNYTHYNDSEFNKEDFDTNISLFIIQNYKLDDILKYINTNNDIDLNIKKTEKGLLYSFPSKKTRKPNELKLNHLITHEDLLIDILSEYVSTPNKTKLIFDLTQKNNDIFVLPIYSFQDNSFETNINNEKLKNNIDGFIYCKKEDVLPTGFINDDNWKDAAAYVLNQEIKDFSNWNQGNIYGIIESEGIPYITNDNKITYLWDNKDSCYGFYSDKYNQELIQEISSNFNHNIFQLSEIPEFLTHTTTVNNFNDSFLECIKCFPPEKTNLIRIDSKSSCYQKDTLYKTSQFLINNMNNKEQRKLNKLFKSKNCTNKINLFNYLNRIAKQEEQLIIPKNKKNKNYGKKDK